MLSRREDAYDFIAVMAGDQELIQIKEKSKTGKGAYDMCQAIQEMIQEGYQEGYQEGNREGMRHLPGGAGYYFRG